MAEADDRIETLEDEVKVLKGEVKRTLVDLRALLMREDSPLSEGALARRAAAATAPPPAPEPPPAASVEADAEAMAPTPAPPPAPEPGLEEMPLTPPQPVMPNVSTPPPAPDTALDPAEQERRLLEQERRMLEQERKLAEQERAARLAKQEAKSQDEEEDALDFDALEERLSPLLEQEEGPGEGPAPAAKPKQARKARASAPATAGEETSRARPDESSRDGQGSPVLDEYRELLESYLEVSSAVEDDPAVSGRPLDVNLMANLMYWASLAKQRIGEEQVKELLQLYIHSGHSRPELQQLLLYISEMVDVPPLDFNNYTQICVDLMFHLHGILTGGFPVIKIPKFRPPSPGESPDLDS